MEQIAKRQIESFVGLNDIFIGEVVSSSNHDGFVHHPQGFRCKLYNGSFVQTVSGDSDTSIGENKLNKKEELYARLDIKERIIASLLRNK